jgi:hypothetical protein
LDGGGTWALLEANMLGAVYGNSTPGHVILSQFDLVAANSGGSIVLGGLFANQTPAQIAQLFIDPAKRGLMFVRNIGIAHWQTSKKLLGLQTIFSSLQPPVGAAPGAVPVAQWTLANAASQLSLWSPGIFGQAGPPKCIISGFNLDRLRETFFRMPPRGSSEPEDNALVIEAIHFSSTAPIKYFDDPGYGTLSGALGDTGFWDGAMGGDNNPLLAAIIECVRNGGQLRKIVALSFGTGSVRLPLPQDLSPAQLEATSGGPLVGSPPSVGNIFSEASVGVGCILDDPPASALYDSHVLLNGSWPPNSPFQVVRMSPLVRPRLDLASGNLVTPVFGVPGRADIDIFKVLSNLDMDATDPSDVAAIASLGAAWKGGNVTNQPLQEITAGVPSVGPLDALGAILAWRSLAPAPPNGWPPLPASNPVTAPF